MYQNDDIGLLAGIIRNVPRGRRWSGYRHAGWNLFSVTRGRVRLDFGENSFFPVPGGVYLLEPETVRIFETMESSSILWIHFQENVLSPEAAAFLHTGFTRAGVRSETPSRPLFLRYLRTMTEIVELEKERPFGWFPLVRSLLENILLRMRISLNNFPEIRENGALEQSRLNICAGKIEIDAAARACGMSRAVFYRNFKRRFGLSPALYREQSRLQTARTLLETDDRNISEIAEVSGFRGVQYFSARFRKQYGLTPSAYRRIVRISPDSHES